MTNETIACEVVYCEGWDPTSRSIVHPLPEATARARDAAGEQYAVVLTADDRPLVLIEICWDAHYAGVWLFDERGRRDRKLDFRRLATADGADMLSLRAVEQWRYGSDEAPEFDEDAATHSNEYDHDGERFESSSSWGDQEHLEIAKPRGPLPAFGDWAALAHLDEILGSRVTLRVRPDPPAGPAPAELPWRPPRPARPPRLDDFFVPGTVFDLPKIGKSATVEVVDGGQLWMPSGTLLAGEPVPYLYEDTPFSDTVEPGQYPLVLSVAKVSDGTDVVAAARLVVSDAETVSWEQALFPGADLRELGDDCYFGRYSDLSRLVIVDAAVAELFEDIIEDRYDDFTDDPAFVVEVTEPESGVNLLAIRSGWRSNGSFPVWAGRAADGSLTSFVVDFLVLG